MSFNEESINSFNKRQVQKELVIFSIHKLETSFCKLSFILYWYLAVSNTIMCMMIKGSNYFILSGFTAWKWLWLMLYHVWIVSKKLFSRSKKALLEFRPFLFMDGRKRLLQMERSWMWQHKWSCDHTLSPQSRPIQLIGLLQGEISPSSLDIPYLKFLDLSLNIYWFSSIYKISQPI